MPAEYHPLTMLDAGIAAALILINGAISVALQLRLERTLLLAAARTIVQLLLIGWLLEWIFDQSHWAAVVALMLFMTLVAGSTAVRRTRRRWRGIWLNGIVSVWMSSWVVTAIALALVIRPDAWREHPAQYAIPLLGMVLGNTLNGISLGLDRLSESLGTRRGEIEMRLTLGATRWEAARPTVREAVSTGLIPITNSMMVVGLVSLPGMMTGQLLAGVPPLYAVRYQIVIMFLIASATALGTISVVLISFLQLSNARHQFPQRASLARPADHQK